MHFVAADFSRGMNIFCKKLQMEMQNCENQTLIFKNQPERFFFIVLLRNNIDSIEYLYKISLDLKEENKNWSAGADWGKQSCSEWVFSTLSSNGTCLPLTHRGEKRAVRVKRGPRLQFSHYVVLASSQREIRFLLLLSTLKHSNLCF